MITDLWKRGNFVFQFGRFARGYSRVNFDLGMFLTLKITHIDRLLIYDISEIYLKDNFKNIYLLPLPWLKIRLALSKHDRNVFKSPVHDSTYRWVVKDLLNIFHRLISCVLRDILENSFVGCFLVQTHNETISIYVNF